MNILKRVLPLGALLIASIGAAHDDSLGARYVEETGANATDCLDHDIPCRSIQYALDQAEHGNTLKIAAGIYDVSDIDPERVSSARCTHRAGTARRITITARIRTGTSRSSSASIRSIGR